MAELINLYAPAPNTVRGRPLQIGVHPKGTHFVYPTGNAIVIRDVANPMTSDMYYEHQHQTTVAKYSPTGFYIASGDVAGKIRIWDTINAEHILKIELPVLTGSVLDLAWDADSKRLVVVGEGKERFAAVFLFDSGSTVGDIGGHNKPIVSVDFKPNRPYRIATGGEDQLVNFFEGPPFKFKQAIKEHKRFVNSVRFAPDGSKFITCGSDKQGLLFDGKTAERVGELDASDAHKGGIYACCWSPDSTKILTVSADKTGKVWNAADGKLLHTLSTSDAPQTRDQLLGCTWTGDTIITCSLGGDLAFFDATSPAAPTKVHFGHSKFVTSLAYNAADHSLLAGSYDGVIYKWDIATGDTTSFSGTGHANQVTESHVQGSRLVTIGWDDTVRYADLGSLAYGDATATESQPQAVAVGHADTELSVVANLSAVLVLRGSKIVGKLDVAYKPSAIAVSRDDKEVAVGGDDNTVHFYSLTGDSLAETGKADGHRGPVLAITYSPDGKYLASSCAMREIFVWDVASKKQLTTGWCFHDAKVAALAWAPDSKHLASGSLDSHIYIWSVENPKARVFNKNAHRGGVNDVVFIGDDILASAGQDCSIKTWKITFP